MSDELFGNKPQPKYSEYVSPRDREIMNQRNGEVLHMLPNISPAQFKQRLEEYEAQRLKNGLSIER